MNYYQPRQREDNGLWHYTCRRDGDIWPVGLCGAFRDCPDCHGESFRTTAECATCENKGVIRLPAEERCPGHDTAEEAEEHMRQYLLTRIKLNAGHMPDQQVRCEIEGCDEWTQHTARVSGLGLPKNYTLCEAHMTEEFVASLITVGQVISS